MKRRKVRKRFKLLVLGFLILSVNAVVAVPRLIEDYKIKTSEDLVDSYIKGYTNNIIGSPRLEKLNNKMKEKYIGVIEIPSIELKRGLPDPYSSNNFVNKNIEIIKPYHMPDEEGKVMILASHSGTSKVAFFDNLRYISLNDNVYIYYNDIKYEYKVIDKYQIKKTGYFNLKDYDNETLLALITCNPNNSKKQIVVICKRTL